MWILRKIYYFLVDILQTLLLAASVFFVIYVFLFRPYQVTGSSMHPTFVNHEYVLTNLITIHLSPLVRGDVIVFHSPTDKEKDFIKRVIGLAGENVSLRGGYIYVNDEKLDESKYLDPSIQTPAGSFLQEGGTVTVANESYFVMGDNRNASSDSREWGYVAKEKVIGKSFFVYWPMERARLVENPYK